jgi:hypothetical protein
MDSVSGLRESAPGLVMTAVSGRTIAVSSTKTVFVMLYPGEMDIDRFAFDVCDFALVEARA